MRVRVRVRVRVRTDPSCKPIRLQRMEAGPAGSRRRRDGSWKEKMRVRRCKAKAVGSCNFRLTPSDLSQWVSKEKGKL